jgi:hypothetical protein
MECPKPEQHNDKGGVRQCCTCHPRISKVDHGVKLLQVVLHGRTTEQHAPARGQARKRLSGGGVRILEAMSLKADDEMRVFLCVCAGKSVHTSSQMRISGALDGGAF